MRNRFVKIVLFSLVSLLLFAAIATSSAENDDVSYTAVIKDNHLTITFNGKVPDKGYYKLFWRKTTSTEAESSIFKAGTKQYTVVVEPGVNYKVSLYYSRTKGTLPTKYQFKDERAVSAAPKAATPTPKPTPKPTPIPTLKPTKKPTPTPKPTAKPTPIPAPKAKAAGYDLPDAMEYLSYGFYKWQFGTQEETKYWSRNNFYNYANWDDPFADVSAFLNIFDGEQWPFRLIAVQEADYIGVRASYYWYYYYEYTGRKTVSPVVIEKDFDKQACHMRIVVNRRYADNQTTIAIKIVPGLKYGGADRKDSDPVIGHNGSIITPPPWEPITQKTMCIKCHGNKEITCTQCDGCGGSWHYSNSAIGGRTGSTWVKCQKCHGTGRIQCTRCHGSGKEN